MPDRGLDRFVQAQAPLYERALAELHRGDKQSHWMWFIFPQVAGLGRSETARFYALAGRSEALAYLSHAVLGKRLLECVHAVLAHPDQTPEAIFGGVDAMKFRSSMTLFEAVADDPAPFASALEQFYAGRRDELTLAALGLA